MSKFLTYLLAIILALGILMYLFSGTQTPAPRISPIPPAEEGIKTEPLELPESLPEKAPESPESAPPTVPHPETHVEKTVPAEFPENVHLENI